MTALAIADSLPTTLARWRRGLWKALRPAVPFVILLIVWQAVVLVGLMPRTSLPLPQDLPAAFVSLVQDHSLLAHLFITLQRVLVGAAIGLSVGLVLGALLALNRRVSDLFNPLINYFQAVGEVGWLPVLILWLGFNSLTITVVIAYTVMFPVFFGTVSGFGAVPPNLTHSIQTLGGGRWRIIREAMLPGSLPAIITGFRTGVGFGWRTVILAELLVGSQGLGVLLFEGRQSFRPDWILVEMVVIGLVWLALDGVVLKPLEQRTVERWGLLR